MGTKGKPATIKDVRYALEFGGERLLRTYSQDDRLRGGRPFHPEQDRDNRRRSGRIINPGRSACVPGRGWAVPRSLAAIRVEG